MQVGFVMLEAGFARSRESINILVEGIVDLVLSCAMIVTVVPNRLLFPL
jgi:ammonia channel protein AmtB